METENKELTEEITKLESDKKMLQSGSAQLIEEKHQFQASVMELKTEIDLLKTENNQQRNQIAAERIQLESHHKEEKLHLESLHQREKQLLQSEVERLTKELELITRMSISTKSLVSTMHSY